MGPPPASSIISIILAVSPHLIILIIFQFFRYLSGACLGKFAFLSAMRRLSTYAELHTGRRGMARGLHFAVGVGDLAGKTGFSESLGGHWLVNYLTWFPPSSRAGSNQNIL